MFLEDLDGRNVLWNIKKSIPTSRKWMVYNIDSVRQLGAIRLLNASLNLKLVSTGTER